VNFRKFGKTIASKRMKNQGQHKNLKLTCASLVSSLETQKRKPHHFLITEILQFLGFLGKIFR
jgi:hypothetical protein